MSDDCADLILGFMRRIDTRLDKMAEDMREVKQRFGHLEEMTASISRRVDAVDNRLDRVEYRLDLAGEPAEP